MIIISEKYERRSSNCTSFLRKNLVAGLPLGRSWSRGRSATFCEKNATEITSYLPEVNFGGVSLEKVVAKVLIFNSRKYEVVVLGQK